MQRYTKERLSQLSSFKLKNLASSTNDPDLLKDIFDVTTDLATVMAILNKNIPDELAIYILDREPDLAWVILNKTENVSPEVLDFLAHKTPRNFDEITNFEHLLPKTIRYILANSSSAYVLYNLAANPSTPLDILEKLSKEEDERIRELVASNPSTPSEILSELAQDPSKSVVVNAVANPNTPEDIVLEVLPTLNPRRYKQILEFNTLPESVLKFFTSDIENLVYAGPAIFRQPNITTDMLVNAYEKYADFLDSDGLKEIALNRKATPAILRDMAKNSNATLRSYVSENPNTPPDALLTLAEDENELLCTVLATNPNLPVEAIDLLINRFPENKRLLDKLSANPNLSTQQKERLYSLAKQSRKDLFSKNFKIYKEGPIKSNTSQDLELLQRLKGYLK